MKPTCKKCGSTALVRDDHGFGDDHEQAVRCLICGWRITRPLAEAPTPIAPPRRNQVMTSCIVEGCDGQSAQGSKSGMCRTCHNRLAVWKRSARTTAAPIVEYCGRWIINPERHGRAAA